MKAKKKIFDVYCKTYGVNLMIIMGMPKDKVRPFLEKKYKVKWDYGDDLKGGGVFSFDVYPFHVLWLSDLVTKKEIVPKLSHEIFHHVLRVCVSRGIPTYPEIDNLIMDEPAAYLMEFYMREIIKNV